MGRLFQLSGPWWGGETEQTLAFSGGEDSPEVADGVWRLDGGHLGWYVTYRRLHHGEYSP